MTMMWRISAVQVQGVVQLLLSSVGFGQLLSLLITATGVASSRLASIGIRAPTTQSLCNYVLLAVVYGTLWLVITCNNSSSSSSGSSSSNGSSPPKRRWLQLKGAWYHYLLLAIVDVEANYLAVKAYQYTSMTSVLLLDRASLLFVILLAWLAFGTKCSHGQLAGVTICIVGVAVLLFSDSHLSSSRGINAGTLRHVHGDALVLVASLLYSISNIGEEFLSKENGFLELTAALGVFGSIVSATQLCLLELHEIRSIHWNVYALLPFLGYAFALFTFYSSVPIFLKLNGSTMLSLSLITSDMWATCAQNYVYHQKVPILYFVAFAVAAFGLIVHSFFTWRSMKQDDLPADVQNNQTMVETQGFTVKNC